MMFRLGLTGSIATGKSTALLMFAEEGVPTYSADQVVHDLYDGPAVAMVGARFPGAIKDGKVDRKLLSSLVIGRPDDLQALEAIVHPLVKQQFDAFEHHHRTKGTPLAVYDIPLLYEGQNTYQLDAVAVTFCDEAEQRRRALLRPDMTPEKLDVILSRQLPQAEKRQRADFEIDTNQSLEQMRDQIRTIIAICHARAALS